MTLPFVISSFSAWILLACLLAGGLVVRAIAEPEGSPPLGPLGSLSLGYDIAEAGLTGRTFVVSPDGDDRNGGSVERPMRSPQAAADRVRPGDTVLLRGGEYTNQGAETLLEIRHGGRRGRWVRFASFPGETAVLRFDGLRGIRVADVSHVVIEGFEIVGVADEIDPADSLAFGTAFQGRDFSQQRYFGVGVRLGDLPGENPHHIIVRGNRIHHTPGGGIATATSDYVLIEGNEVFKTAFHSPWGESGISLWRSVDSDGNQRTYKMVVKDNLVYQNDNLVPFWMRGDRTDGNGIILDANDAAPGVGRDEQSRYRGRFLVVNNVCFGNGGRGIRVFETSNVDLLHNTVHQNATRAGMTREVELTGTDLTRVFNNLIVASEGNEPIGLDENRRVEVDFNLVHPGPAGRNGPAGRGGSAAQPGDHTVFARPVFEAPPPAVAPGQPAARVSPGAFRLAAGSPGRNAGSPERSFPVDLAGRARPEQEAPDLGALESPGP